MIRALNHDEVGLCVEGGKSFFEEAKLPGVFIPSVFTQAWEGYIEGGIGTILALFKDGVIAGAIGIVKCPSMFNHDVLSAEAFWYTLPGLRGGGVKLLLAYEQWAKANGITMMTMVRLNGFNEHLHSIYLRMGFTELETTYFKIL